MTLNYGNYGILLITHLWFVGNGRMVVIVVIVVIIVPHSSIPY